MTLESPLRRAFLLESYGMWRVERRAGASYADVAAADSAAWPVIGPFRGGGVLVEVGCKAWHVGGTDTAYFAPVVTPSGEESAANVDRGSPVVQRSSSSVVFRHGEVAFRLGTGIESTIVVPASVPFGVDAMYVACGVGTTSLEDYMFLVWAIVERWVWDPGPRVVVPAEVGRESP